MSLVAKWTIFVPLARVASDRTLRRPLERAPPAIADIACLSSSTLSAKSLIRITAMTFSREREGEEESLRV
jgi:hypothetical protein